MKSEGYWEEPRVSGVPTASSDDNSVETRLGMALAQLDQAHETVAGMLDHGSETKPGVNPAPPLGIVGLSEAVQQRVESLAVRLATIRERVGRV